MMSSPTTNQAEEQSYRLAFRRGKTLVLTMMTVTTAFLFQDEVRKLWTEGVHALTLDRVVNWFLIGCLCWYAARGSRFAAGCFSLVYGIIFLLFLIAGVGSVFLPHFSGGVGNVDLKIGDGWPSALRFAATGIWTAFSLWVLLFSKDARVYMKARRQGIAGTDANAFEWPPARRRQQ